MQLFTIRKLFFALFRRRRMRLFYAIFRPSAQTRLLDIGGAPQTWISESQHYPRFPVTLVNLRFRDPAVLTDGRFTAVDGDATDLPFPDQSFEIAFSNSVIEHLTTWERQQAFASHARRVAKKLWIQTPARAAFAHTLLSIPSPAPATAPCPAIHSLGTACKAESGPS